MTQIHDFELEVHRHSDGSIDFDHYRARATALRGAALRDAAALTFRFIMILAVTITGVVLVANAPAPVVEAACLHCTRSLVPVDEPPAATHIASFPRTSRAE